MGLFRKAASSKIGLKILAYGDSGVGKSTFALTFPKIAAIDSENGLAHYEGNPNLVFIANTSSAYDVEDAISEVEENMDAIETFVVDSETKIYDNMQISAMEVEEKRARKKGGDVEDSVVSMRGWGRVKLVNKRLQNLKIQLSSQGVNIISIAQMEDVKEKRGEQFVKVGEKPNMAKGVQFDYDTILKLYTEKNSKGEETYKAIIEKDRTGIFKKGEIIENPSFEYWKDYYSKASTLEKRVINFNKDLDNDMKKMQDETDNLEDIIKEFKTLMKELPKENQVKVAKLLKEKGIDNPLKTDNLEAMMEVVDFIKAL